MIKLSNQSYKFIETLDAKQYRQVVKKIFSLTLNPYPNDSIAVKGHTGLFRVDIGEYRIIYEVGCNQDQEEIIILQVGKRNDGVVYNFLKR